MSVGKPVGRYTTEQVYDARSGGVVVYQAFTPDPLPPTLAPSHTLTTLLAAASHALGELSGVGLLLPRPDLLTQPLMFREALLSSRIEGTRATALDLATERLAQLMGAPGTSRDAHEVSTCVDALHGGMRAIASGQSVSLWLIRQLHQTLMTGVVGGDRTPGAFRTEQNYLGSGLLGIQHARYIPPPVRELQPALHALEQYIIAPDDLPHLLRIACVHYQFETLHPFGDGNGRVGRLLIVLLLLQWGLLSQPLLTLSAFLEQHRREYVGLLGGVSSAGEWDAWLCFFLHGVEQAAVDGRRRAQHLMMLRQEWQALLRDRRAPTNDALLADHLFAYPVLSASAVQRLLGVTARAARMILDRFVGYGILVPVDGRTYGRQFMATAILNAIDLESGIA